MNLNTAFIDGPMSFTTWFVAMLLLLFFVVWLATAAARAWVHTRIRRQSRRFLADAQPLLRTGQWAKVIELSASKAMRLSPVAQTLGMGLECWLSQREADADPVLAWQVAQACMRQVAEDQTAKARRGLRTLIVAGGTAPLAGFVGAAFQLHGALFATATLGSSVIPGAAAGLLEALPMPAFGLFTSMLALWTGAWLARSAERIRLEIGRATTDVLAELARQKPTDGNA